jgi:dCTP diphosphatase
MMPNSKQLDSLQQLQSAMRVFVDERDWQQFHTPKNLAMAMIVEAAELVEILQWDTPEQSQQMDANKREQLSHELADTLLYLIRLADVLGIDLIQAAQQKMLLNAQKYPVEKAKGSSAKYTDL